MKLVSFSFGEVPVLLLLLLFLSRVDVGLSFSVNQTTIPAVIVFGDSIVDPGNNNGRLTTAKCNYPPYGKDFPGHKPTGRFSNGRVPGDMIASALGVKEYVPAYVGAELTPEDILTGVSFASGGSGYDPLTSALSSALSMTDQLKLLEEYKQKLTSIVGDEGASTIISESLYIVCSGSNDVSNTYFLIPIRNAHYDIPSYINLMTTSASSFIKQLYQLGARKIGFISLPPTGCLPSQRTIAGGIERECEPSRNEAALLFNSNFNQEVNRLQRELEGSIIVFIDIYPVFLDLIQNPSTYGFEESTKGCCGTGLLEVTYLCNSITTTTCQDDTKYVFWDSFHPTERSYQIIIDDALEKYIRVLL